MTETHQRTAGAPARPSAPLLTTAGAELVSALLSLAWGLWMCALSLSRTPPSPALPYAAADLAALLLGVGLVALGGVWLTLLLVAAPGYRPRLAAAILGAALWAGALLAVLQGWLTDPDLPTAGVCLLVNGWVAFTLALTPSRGTRGAHGR